MITLYNVVPTALPSILRYQIIIQIVYLQNFENKR